MAAGPVLCQRPGIAGLEVRLERDYWYCNDSFHCHGRETPDPYFFQFFPVCGFALVLTGMILGYGSVIIPKKDLKVAPSSGIWVGLAQGLAAFPGISRSGLTIVTGLRTGLAPERAFSLFFLLSLPAIMGATVLEFSDAGSVKGLISSLPAGWWVRVMAALSRDWRL